jgi:hypothetical protein
VASNRPFDPRKTTRRFTLYANDVEQMVFLPRLLAFLKKEAFGATLRTSPIPLENPGQPWSGVMSMPRPVSSII